LIIRLKKTKPKTAAAGSGFEAFLKIRKREGLFIERVFSNAFFP